MKSREFGAVLRTFADVLDAAGAAIARDHIVMFAAAFDADPTSSVSEFAKRVASVREPRHAGSPSLDDLACLLSALKGFLDKTAKKAVLTDIDALQKLLRDRASMEISAFVRMATEVHPRAAPTKKRVAARVREDLVVRYKDKLEASLGDEEMFLAVMNELRADTAIGKPEIVALAKDMTGTGARTEDAALKKIWNRHRSLVVFRAKSRATGGRSAA
jgi:hypothetical protein